MARRREAGIRARHMISRGGAVEGRAGILLLFGLADLTHGMARQPWGLMGTEP